MPVLRASKFEFIVNLQTAKIAIGLDNPARAARQRRRGDRVRAGASSSRGSAARRRRGRSQPGRRAIGCGAVTALPGSPANFGQPSRQQN